MDNTKLKHYFLLTLMLGAGVISFFILRPFIYIVVLALVCAVIFDPIHRKILKLSLGNRTVAALVTTVLIIVIILIIFVLMG